LIVATVLTLTFLPALYAAWFKATPPKAATSHDTDSSFIGTTPSAQI
jgi:hypothetical protein